MDMTQDDFLREAKLWKNILLTWSPWTGKTYITKKLIDEFDKLWKKVVVVAPTWIAAINIEWATIHSAFKIHPGDLKNIPRQAIDWESIDTIVFDEVSMVWPDMFDFCKTIIEYYVDNWLPFGWIQIIIVWDFDQLPPVYKKVEPEDKEYYDKLITLYWWDKCTDSHWYKNSWFININLNEVFRQKDERLLSVITDIKNNNIRAIHRLQRSWWTFEQWNNSVHLMPYNNMVDAFNDKAFNNISSREVIFHSKVVWRFNIKNVLTPKYLKLKQWCRAMITKNLKNWLMNWDLWYISSINNWTIEFKSDRTWEIVYICNETWEQYEYLHWEKVAVWSYTQLPVKLAYAITIHKSQWLSLDSVIVHYIPSMSKEQLYVAVSRATNYEWIFLTWN